MNSKPRRSRSAITEQFKEIVVRDHHDNNLTFLQIAHKHSCCFNTAKTICERNEYGFWNQPAILAKGTVKHFRSVSDEREKLTTEERMEELSKDAIEVIELLFQRVVLKLSEDNCDLSASQLAAFVTAVAPYAIAKKSGDGKKYERKKVPSRDVFSMFKEQLNQN